MDFQDWEFTIYRYIRRNNVHWGTSAKSNSPWKDLCKTELSLSMHQTYDKTEVRTLGRSLRSSSQKADTQQNEVQIDKIYHWSKSSTVLQWLQAAHNKNKCSFQTKQQKYWKKWTMDQLKHVRRVRKPFQILFRLVRIERFPNKLKSVKSSKEMLIALNIAKLSPFIEEDKKIWVKGRLKHSKHDYYAKNPILLTAKFPL